ncbi:hypothetical protein O181_035080 [Austropuccinia psidii MF-1]|uniref:GAG-pre-integrase domain-containing protein n=1 Tax=Austropuccinia psidii MF-1 TaxID=1389203 RepID=A0A9Q3D684_9BASI|nr:hypothetical protein [Austropuccinia psidii MF-1]
MHVSARVISELNADTHSGFAGLRCLSGCKYEYPYPSLVVATDSTISTGYDSSSLIVVGKGTSRPMDQNGQFWTLKNSLYLLNLNTNLVALSQLASQINIKSNNKNVSVFLNETMNPSFNSSRKRKVLETKSKPGPRCFSTARDYLWHQRLGHLNDK